MKDAIKRILSDYAFAAAPPPGWTPEIDLADAWQIIKRVVGDGHKVELYTESVIDSTWRCTLDDGDWTAVAPSPSDAICQAVLKMLAEPAKEYIDHEV